jgi:thioredoxin-dependent peroxiredoxin
VLDSIQLTAAHKVATPVNWKYGEDVIIVPAVSDEEARQKYPNGWTAPKPYLRIIPQPDVPAPKQTEDQQAATAGSPTAR